MPAWLLVPLKWLGTLLFDYVKDLLKVMFQKRQHVVVEKKKLEPLVKGVVEAAAPMVEELKLAKKKQQLPQLTEAQINKVNNAADSLNRSFF